MRTIDPIYNIDCTISKELSDETYYYDLKEKHELSYFLHKDLIDECFLFDVIRKYNDNYHKNENNRKHLAFCIYKTIFMNIYGKEYIALSEVSTKGK